MTTADPASPTSSLSPELPLAELERLHLASQAEGISKRSDGLQITDEELERFRAQWREEVKARKGDASVGGIGGSGGAAGTGEKKSFIVGGGGAGTTSKSQSQQPIKSEGKLAERTIKVSPTATKTKLPLKVTSPKNIKHPALVRPPDLDNDNDEDFLPHSGPSKIPVSGTALGLANVSSKTSSTSTANPASAAIAKSRAPPKLSHAAAEKERAVQLYAKAVEHEQSGKLNDALMMYRRAFKMDDDVDRLYARSVAKAAQSTSTTGTGDDDGPESTTPSSTDIVSASAPADEPYSFQRHIQMQPDYVKSNLPIHPDPRTVDEQLSTLAPPSVLTRLLETLPVPPQTLSFLPADEDLPIPISKLPAELLDPILAHLDVTSIERFASTCWRARYLTHVSNVWRRLVLGIYKPPAMIPEEVEVRDLVKRHRGEWRTTFLEEERVRMDGCYIAVCHYIRPGAGDEWVTITHLITYHRFLRFYPDGSVISFLTTEHPSEIVPSLRPTLRGKGLHFGRWRLLRSDAPLSPDDPPYVPTRQNEKRPPARIIITDLLEPGLEGPKYEFEMELALRETSRGRWNKLDMIDYRSINLTTGESLALPLKHQKPFYFSKVRSYNPPL
ncbi:hypothetical protein CI109_101471 [Kwoniella shandongensis]|uniref:Uncharacterized protein n=1 Tax=Kwoniella shandongensis TaxID=1734106 RepID=A0A5M6C448_9TREE|nr:uncharacterized protein CI109_001935 [Kwoniella shandongensis]KAA5529510.1 hypothetical protein CI109_001935 [Kwoniella shandongensis]